MYRRPPSFTRTYTLFSNTTVFLSLHLLPAIALGEVQPVHDGDDPVVGGHDVLVGEMPVGRVLQGVLFDGAGDPTHFAQADSASHAYDAGEQYRALNRSAVLPAQMGQALGESRRAVDRRQDFGEGHEVAQIGRAHV